MNDRHQPFLDLVSGAMARMNDERKAKATNMRLGQFIDALTDCDQSLYITLDDGRGVHGFMSYRGYYEDLAVSPRQAPKTVGEVRAEAQAALGEIFEGYKGGDFAMNKQSLLWVAPYGHSSGIMLTGIRKEANRVVVETVTDPDYL